MTGPPAEFVAVPAWRWRTWVHPPSWAISVLALIGFTLAALLGVALVGASFALLQWTTDGAEWAVIVALCAAIMGGVAWTCHRIGRWASRRTAACFTTTITGNEPARGLMLAELRESGPPRDGWTGTHATRWVEEIRRHSPARLLIAQSLEERARRYDRTDRPVEPERVGGPMGSASLVALVFLAAVSGAMFWMRGARSPLGYMMAGGAVFALVRLVRRRALFAPIVAGQGWIEHGTARWTVEDSVILVTGRSTATVRVVGPPGVLTMTLATGRGKDFEALWMRWMHPVPDLQQRAFEA